MDHLWPQWAVRLWLRPRQDLRPGEPRRLTCAEALAEERALLFAGADPVRRARTEGAALCLSGGGIRSAAVCLGVLQSLATKRVLTRFHFMSTVSGGGYAASWLQAWIHNTKGDADSVQAALGGVAEPPEVNRLREWSNYLTPKPGLLSADTWTGVTLGVRNVLVNWMVFGPLLLAAASIPVVYGKVIDKAQHIGVDPAHPNWAIVALALGAVALLFSTVVACDYLPSHIILPGEADKVTMDQVVDERQPPERELNPWGVRQLVIAPVMLWALLVPVWWSAMLKHHVKHGSLQWDMELVPPCVGAGTMLLGYMLVMVFGSKDYRQRAIYNANFLQYLFAAAAGSAALLAGGVLATHLRPQWIVLVAVLGPPWVVGSHMLQTMIYVALRRDPARGDLDREWLARVSAVKAMAAGAWLFFTGATVLLPLLAHDVTWLKHLDARVTGLGAVASGGLAAWLARSAKAAGTQVLAAIRSKVTITIEWVISIASVMFGLLLFASLGRLVVVLMDATPRFPHFQHLPELVPAIAAGLGVLAAFLVNVNRFSLHAVYRNRLSRAFLGSTIRAELRLPDPWTGFDPFDNPRLTDLRPQSGGRTVLLPIITTALNLASGSRWPERKARPFTMSPLHCGFGDPPPGGRAFRQLRARRAEGKSTSADVGAYVDTQIFAGNERETGVTDQRRGITLATAMALSGAAVSPNMGYHSQPTTAFIMTLFNVRLGAWLPNPARAPARAISFAKPPLFGLIDEMRGRTDDDSQAVYLSDGGHFDNLGLYEALRRRPARVVVVDATADPGYRYEDLASALRKVLTDLDARVTFLEPLKVGEPPPNGFAEAEVRYAEDDGEAPARLIYIKSCKPADLPVALQEFASRHADFPHASTGNQFFTETQFESYRSLGERLGIAASGRVAALFEPGAPNG